MKAIQRAIHALNKESKLSAFSRAKKHAEAGKSLAREKAKALRLMGK